MAVGEDLLGRVQYRRRLCLVVWGSGLGLGPGLGLLRRRLGRGQVGRDRFQEGIVLFRGTRVGGEWVYRWLWHIRG